MKGADLALTLYTNFALRPMCDLDLLVHRERLDEAVSQLSRIGYRKALPEVATGHHERTASAVYLIGGPRESVAVELHWGLVAGCDDRRSPENLDWFWSQTEPAAVDIEQSPQIELPKTFFHLTPNAHLLYLVAHLMLQHGGARLLWYYDIHLFVANNRHLLNWEEISTHACELGWFASLQAALAGVNERFRTSLPDDMRPSNEVKRGLSQPRGGDKPYDEAAWDEVMGLSWPARVHYLWDNFFPSTTYIQWRYQPRPKWLWPLCYLFRWSVFRAGALKLATRRVTKRKW